MSRVMRDGEAVAWCAVIITKHPSEDPLRPPVEHTSYAGPFASKGAASGAITRAKSRAAWIYQHDESKRPTVTGYPERSTAWAQVDN